MSNLRVNRLTQFDQFNELKEDWDNLGETGIKTFFLSHSWLTAWWQFYGQMFKPWILTVYEDDWLVGILPLVLTRDSLGIRRLSFMGAGELTPNHLNMIGARERFPEILRAICESLHSSSSEWDFLDLDKLPSDESIASDILESFGRRGFSVATEVTARCPYVELPETFDLYLQSRGSSTRAAYRRAKRALEKDYSDAHFDRVELETEFDQVFNRLISLHQARWTSRGYPGAFYSQKAKAFHRSVSLASLQSGTLRMYYIRVAGDVIAVYNCFKVKNSVQYYIGGFDDRLSKYSPGLLITGYSIQQSIIEGASHFDFLEGDEGYKSHWASGVRENVCLRVFSPRWQGRLARFGIQASVRLKELGVRYAPVKIRRPFWQAVQRYRAGS